MDTNEPVVTTAEPRPGVLLITLNRPHVRNAVDQVLAGALDSALTRLESDPSLRVGVLSGAGGHFCSGMDLKAFPAEGVPLVADRGLGGLTRARIRKPLIAAVEGAAVAGGFELALACDLITASETAFFALPEVARGLIAAEGGAVRLPGRLPYHVAMEMLLTAARRRRGAVRARQPGHAGGRGSRRGDHPGRVRPGPFPRRRPHHQADRPGHPRSRRPRGLHRPGSAERAGLHHTRRRRGGAGVHREASPVLEPLTGGAPAGVTSRGRPRPVRRPARRDRRPRRPGWRT